MHMLVYVAYSLVISHVFLGALQSERNPFFPAALGIGFVGLMLLHLAAFAKEQKLDRMGALRDRMDSSPWLGALTWSPIPGRSSLPAASRSLCSFMTAESSHCRMCAGIKAVRLAKAVSSLVV